ncbi:MAG: hypothetical protein ACYC9I_11575 [Desulfuromonadales bacterium]
MKALKKLEEEQTGRPAASPSGAGGQFVAPPRAGRRPLLLLLVGIGAGLLLAGGLYALFGERSATSPATSSLPLVQKPADFSETVAPATNLAAGKAAPAGRERAAPTAATSAITAAPQEAIKRPAETEPVKAVRAVAVAPAPVADKTRTEVRSGTVEQVQVERREIPAPGQQWAASHLSVSEILPDSGGGRMAIVNDLPVMEGTIVEDAVVKEIHPDRVLFVIDGKSVVVPLTPR